jgi:hypothetical protein
MCQTTDAKDLMACDDEAELCTCDGCGRELPEEQVDSGTMLCDACTKEQRHDCRRCGEQTDVDDLQDGLCPDCTDEREELARQVKELQRQLTAARRALKAF